MLSYQVATGSVNIHLLNIPNDMVQNPYTSMCVISILQCALSLFLLYYRPTVVYLLFFYFQAWEDTYAKWDQATKQILNFPKNKADDGQVGMLHRR